MSEEKNCFNLPHKKSSISICVIGMIVNAVVLVLSGVTPEVITRIYNMGLTDEQSLICGVVFFSALVVLCIFLAIGLYLDSPCPMMVWLIGNTILWNVHLIVVLASAVITATRNTDDKESSGIIVARILALVFFQVGWMTVICLVGRHWYVLCEEIMAEEYPDRRLPSMRQRFRTWSTWSRRAPSVSGSVRMPVLLDRMHGTRN